MGFHVCEYCAQGAQNKYPNTSSGDCSIKVPGDDHVYHVPDMILHYVDDHGWIPPTEFIQNIINNPVETLAGDETSLFSTNAKKVGYLTGPFPTPPTKNVPNFSSQLGMLLKQRAIQIITEIPQGFLAKLEAVLAKTGQQGGRAQTRGTPPPPVSNIPPLDVAAVAEAYIDKATVAKILGVTEGWLTEWDKKDIQKFPAILEALGRLQTIYTSVIQWYLRSRHEKWLKWLRYSGWLSHREEYKAYHGQSPLQMLQAQDGPKIVLDALVALAKKV